MILKKKLELFKFKTILLFFKKNRPAMFITCLIKVCKLCII